MSEINNVDIGEVKKELGIISGKKVSHVWRGHGTYASLELGEIHEKEVDSPKGKYTVKEGDWTLALDGDWKMFKGTDEIADSINDDLKVLDFKLQLLQDLTIKSTNLSEDNKSASIFFDKDLAMVVGAAEYGFMSIRNYERKRWLILEPNGKVKVEY
ncbi:MAG: hypothetical protein WAV56_02890 [Microgenomates group bacterium]